jgi:hypothetical protein
MAQRSVRWERQIVRRLTTSVAAVLAVAGTLVAPACAQDSTIIATVAPSVGFAVGADGTVVSDSSSVPAIVTRERRGNTVVITIVPQ